MQSIALHLKNGITADYHARRLPVLRSRCREALSASRYTLFSSALNSERERPVVVSSTRTTGRC